MTIQLPGGCLYDYKIFWLESLILSHWALTGYLKKLFLYTMAILLLRQKFATELILNVEPSE